MRGYQYWHSGQSLVTFLYASTSHENTSQYQCTSGLTIGDNKEKYQIGDYCLVEKQIPRTKTARNMLGKMWNLGKLLLKSWNWKRKLRKTSVDFVPKIMWLPSKKIFLERKKQEIGNKIMAKVNFKRVIRTDFSRGL